MISLKNITKKYGNLLVLHDFNIDIDDGKIICLFGPSGCGKTTLLNIIAGLIKYDEGNVLGIDDKRISYIFQETRLLPWSTIEDNIIFVLRDKYNKDDAIKIARDYLRFVELLEYKDYYPHQLSGGMKQRVSIARAFAYESEILLMDEPFKGLDIELKRNLINIFLSLWKKNNKTVVFVTHDIDEALLISNTVYVLGGKPSNIKEKVDINVVQRERKLNSQEMIKYKEEIVKAIK